MASAHFQPAERVAQALRGVLVVTRAGDADEIHHVVEASGLDVRLWDNGSADLGPARSS